jgi:hypothetical protein
MVRDSDITITRHLTDGFTLSATVGDHLVQRRYMGYTVREAKRMFRKEFNR